MAWQEHKAEDGRTYYFDPETQNSTWDKPEELFTEREIALSRTNWKEYTAEGGRKYWFNTESQESVWVFPADAEAILQGEAAADETIPKEPREVREQRGREKREEHLPSLSSIAPSTLKALPYESDAVSADNFKVMLQEHDVDKSWTVRRMMKEMVADVRYWRVRDAMSRRNLFEDYLSEIDQKKEAETMAARVLYQQQVYDLYASAENSGKTVTAYSRWSGVEKQFADDPLFQIQTPGAEDDRKLALAKYMRFLKERDEKTSQETKASGKEFLTIVLGDLKVDIVKSTWHETLRRIQQQSGDLAAQRPEMRHLNKLDLLDVYAKYIRDKEGVMQDTIDARSGVVSRQARVARQQFVKLLQEHVALGNITYLTKWKDLVVHIKDDPRFSALCGIRHSSTPLDLFWDVIEVEQRHVRTLRAISASLLASTKQEIDSLDEAAFTAFVESNVDYKRNLQNPAHTLQVYKSLKDKDFEADRFASDRKMRRQQDDFRYALRDMEPVIKAGDSWDAVRRVADRLPEAKGLTSAQREAAFEKYMSRLREREHVERDRERDRERERAPRGPPPRREFREKRVSLDY